MTYCISDKIEANGT